MSKLLCIAFSASEQESCAAFAQQLGLPWALLLFGGEARTDLGADTVWQVGSEDVPPSDATAAWLQGLAADFSYIAAASSMQSKDVLARLAGLIDAAMVTDAIAIESSTRFKRPIVAGSAIATVETLVTPVVVTFRSSNFRSPMLSGQSSVASIEAPAQGSTRRLSRSARSGTRPDLSQASVVVSGGRPLKNAETFESVIGGLADALGGAVGATRAAVDSGIAPNECQVGQTGKIVAPGLYVAAGVSGSTQHVAGMKDSKVIVAINTDPDAPIFEVADLGLVQDLFTAIPEIRSKLGR